MTPGSEHQDRSLETDLHPGAGDQRNTTRKVSRLGAFGVVEVAAAEAHLIVEEMNVGIGDSAHVTLALFRKLADGPRPLALATDLVSRRQENRVFALLTDLGSVQDLLISVSPVKLALAMNPKCAQPVAMRFVSFLQDNDLRNIMKSRDVHRIIAATARRILTKKGKI